MAARARSALVNLLVGLTGLVAASAGCNGRPLHDELLSALWSPDAGSQQDAAVSSRVDAATPPRIEPKPSAGCAPVVTSDSLPARAAASAASADSGQTAFFTRDLFNLFRSHCGACHVDSDRGRLSVSLSNFSQTVTQKSLSLILSDDPTIYMPPSGPDAKPFSERAPGDPVVELATLLEQWLSAGSPPDRFLLVSDTAVDTERSPYLIDKKLGAALTNLGSCIPDRGLVGTDTSPAKKLDALFAKATELPDHLQDTDLVSLDSEKLARQGVIAFAPAYPLWADDAKRMRAVRVPLRQAIQFDKTTQRFEIPPNTRFYETFLKRIIDDDGKPRYRKVETRVIVSRPDAPSYNLAPHPHSATRSLFGTYVWNDAESDAVLLRDPLRDGRPWRDRLLTLVADAPAARKITDGHPANVQDALEKANATRTYAVPGSERCWQCHQGSDNASFVLGFTPLQLKRRPRGEGGVIDPSARDELNQLQRLIGYGVIKGMASPKDVVLLEDSEGERKPRNDYELQAQGYVVGNCSFCHNQNGYALSVAPELDTLLDFRPGVGGGIFQFPIDSFSPRIHRGATQGELIPYITPSVLDHEPAGDSSNNWKPKVVVTLRKTDDGTGTGNTYTGEFPSMIFAPWRSLIYRNVDTPFSYAEDFALFPRMPMNTPGYDCRARRIFGSWMASIPALWKGRAEPHANANAEVRNDARPQPYVEIAPGDREYTQAVQEAQSRVRLFQESVRYSDCPDPPVDIVDPDVVNGYTVVPRPIDRLVTNSDGTKGTLELNMPHRPHWAVTDLTEPPGDWAPRRSDWYDVLVNKHGLDKKPDERMAVELTQSVTLTEDLVAFALTDRPFSVWVEKSGCDFTGIKQASDFRGVERPRWMDVQESGVTTGHEHVYDISPGAELFTTICLACHGAKADSTGRVAATIADMTGGETRVANLRDGLLGPVGEPGKNRQMVFGVAAGNGVSVDDWAARYVAWMGLGGTQRVIPAAVLTVVGNTVVVNRRRESFHAPTIGGNMLTVAQVLCADVLPALTWSLDLTNGQIYAKADPKSGASKPALIEQNGDFEMWSSLCALNNPLPVRVVDLPPGVTRDQIDQFTARINNTLGSSDTPRGNYGLYKREAYPPNTPVGDDQGSIQPSMSAGIRAPWCIRKPTRAQDLIVAQQVAQDFGRSGEALPFCPDSLFVTRDNVQTNQLSQDEVNRWTMRGAMNAGLSVFLYMAGMLKGTVPPVTSFDACERVKH